MEGIVCNFRQGRHTQKNRHMIIEVHGVASKEKAAKLVGKKVEWTSSAGKKLFGEIRAAHGCNGAVRAIFEHGLPGQAVGTKVKITE
ncbi:MAG TPA: 50S ribosomal protein L35ae [Nanoarchaeota archaeon]|nr:50S ribosomal protein L35ae [Nanoarchaeota archaeon]